MESGDLEDKTLRLKHSHEGAKTQRKNNVTYVHEDINA